MTAKDTITAEMAFMFGERNSGGSTIDYPMGGSKAIIEALIRGMQKFGGRLMLRSHVDEIVVEGKTLPDHCCDQFMQHTCIPLCCEFKIH